MGARRPGQPINALGPAEVNAGESITVLVFTPGPTEVPARVLRRMAAPITNPDVDRKFVSFYEGVQSKLMALMKTKNDVLIMSAEGLLGLEAAVASLVGRGDKVLTVTNGVFGDGFVDFVKLYRGVPVPVLADYDRPIDPEKVAEALDANRSIKVATFVHCETPSGVLNPLKEVSRQCRKRDVVLVADVVSSLGGVPVEADAWGVDVCLGASQKCISAPPGLALVSVSDHAWEAVRSRKDKIPSYYLSLGQWNEWWKKSKLFPYTPSVSDIYALDEALDMISEEGLRSVFSRHAKVSRALLAALRAMGLSPFPASDEFHSPTVTAFRRPARIDEERLRAVMESRYSVMIAGSWGKLTGKVLRLGNMGYNAYPQKAIKAARALENALKDLGFMPKRSGVVAAKELLR
ncbi:MAG TPA: alanine--glyoxylate aminotransferase family protein [Nitrososphaerales archaeon]|nr:alanine--glyoxylate aminotransferase family protein [Nitrososphaerales archaeon]